MPFGALRPRVERWLAKLRMRLGMSGGAYWEDRARLYGRRAVLNLGHTDEAFDAITKRQREILLPLLEASLRGDEKVALDFGCGPGRFTADLARCVGEAIGVDPIEDLVGLAPEAPNTRYAVMRDNRIPLDDEAVDVVWVCLVLGGLDARAAGAALAEIDRVLRPGGLLFLVENTSEKPDEAHWRYRSVDTHCNLVRFTELERIGDYDDLGERISIMRGYKS